MAHLIDKSALVAEIENLENTYKKCPTHNSYEEGLKDGRLIGYKDALHKIDTLEVKEISDKYDGFLGKELKMVDDEIERLEKLKVKEVDLEKAEKEWLTPQLDKSYANYGEAKMMELTHFDGYAMLDAIEFGAKWQKQKEYTCYEEAFEDGAKWKVENLWKPADGDDLPEIDREVIVLINYNAQRNIHDEEYPTYRVGFGHRPNPNGWDGKNIDTNEVTHYTPKLYDKGGWNAPDIAYWLDVELPKEIEL